MRFCCHPYCLIKDSYISRNFIWTIESRKWETLGHDKVQHYYHHTISRLCIIVITTVPNHWLNRENCELKHYSEYFGVKYWICNDPLSNLIKRRIARVNLFNLWIKPKIPIGLHGTQATNITTITPDWL